MDDMFPAEALMETERRYGAAVRAGDSATLERLLHPHFVSIRANGRSLNRAEEFDALRSDGPGVDGLVPEETIATVNGRTGITRRVLAAEGAPAEQPSPERVLCTRTWVQEDGEQGEGGGWRLLMTRVGPAPAPDETPGAADGLRLPAGC